MHKVNLITPISDKRSKTNEKHIDVLLKYTVKYNRSVRMFTRVRTNRSFCVNVFTRRYSSKNHPVSTETEKETSHFNKLASTWWDIDGPQRILHKMNLARMDFINDTIRRNLVYFNEPGVTGPEDEIYNPGYDYMSILPEQLSSPIKEDQKWKMDEKFASMKNSLNVLDVGCGGGILSESMARLSIVRNVTGLDLADEVLQAAKLHKNEDYAIKDKITYKLKAVEELDGKGNFDIVTMFEILEHVDKPIDFLKHGLKQLKDDGGILFLSTINKDFVSWLTTIFVAEYLMGIVPVGTHHLSKYVDFKTLNDFVKYDKEKHVTYRVVNAKGGMYLPFVGWKLHPFPEHGNYFMAIQKLKNQN